MPSPKKLCNVQLTPNGVEQLIKRAKLSAEMPLKEDKQLIALFDARTTSLRRILRRPEVLRLIHSTSLQEAYRYLAEGSRRRNACVSISRLPDEILHEIFSFVLEDVDITFHQRQVAIIYLVRSRWHDLVSKSPLLLDLVSSDHSLAYSSMVMSKSTTAPIRIHGRFHYTPLAVGQERARFLDNAADNIHRWSYVNLHLELPCNEVLKRMEKPALRIEEITLGVNWTPEGTVQRTDLFAGQAPRLRLLRLYNLVVPWDSPIFAQLTTLRISNVGQMGPSLRQLFDMLINCPKIANLSLECIKFAESDFELTTTLTLPNLVDLRLDELQQTAFKGLLSAIHAPRCTRFNISHSFDLSLAAANYDLPTIAVLKASFPAVFRILETPTKVSLWAPDEYYATLDVRSTQADHLVSFCFPGVPLAALLHWFSELSPTLSKVPANVELECFDFSDTTTLDALDSCLRVDDLTIDAWESDDDRDMGPLLRYLRKRKFPYLRGLSIFHGVVRPKQVLKMLKGRYRASQEVPVRLDVLDIDDAKRFDQRIFDKIRKVVSPIRCLRWNHRSNVDWEDLEDQSSDGASDADGEDGFGDDGL